MSAKVIDLAAWRDGEPSEEEPRTHFALWGDEGERGRLALPVWRALYLMGGDRGGVFELREGGDLEPFLVLDLGADPARVEFDGGIVSRLAEASPPALRVSRGVGGIVLAREAGREWFLLVAGKEVGSRKLDRGSREDLLFVAGECAGLLCHRDLSSQG